MRLPEAEGVIYSAHIKRPAEQISLPAVSPKFHSTQCHQTGGPIIFYIMKTRFCQIKYVYFVETLQLPCVKTKSVSLYHEYYVDWG